MIQTIATIIIVAAAALWAVWRVRGWLRGRSGCACAHCPGAKGR